MSAFEAGLLAGYGIAIPVGAIAVLIIDLSLRKGFRAGFAAGAGVASADLVYAALAAAAGQAIATAIGPLASSLRLASGVVLVSVACFGLWRSRRRHQEPGADLAEPGNDFRVYGQFLGLTILNPMTVTYFGALILGGAADSVDSLEGRLLFVLGAGLASLSWQSLLALSSTVARRRISPRMQLVTSLLGNLIVLGFGLRTILAALAG